MTRGCEVERVKKSGIPYLYFWFAFFSTFAVWKEKRKEKKRERKEEERGKERENYLLCVYPSLHFPDH